MKMHILIAGAALWLMSCSSSKTVSIPVTHPAEITMPADAKTILVADRTKLSNEMLNVLEGIVTGEMPSDDKNAAFEAMMSLKNKLDQSPRFNVKIHPDRLTGNSMTGSLPQALDWGTVNQLCQASQADILVCLELFDSDFIVTKGSRMKKKMEGTGENKKEVEYTEYYAEGVGRIKMGFRAYYNKGRTIVDQQVITRDNTWEGTGTNPGDALKVLITKANANKHLAGKAGQLYAGKIAPLPGYEARNYYHKSKDIPEVAAGSRNADVNKWNDAINTWKSALTKANGKDAGKIAYNIAVGYEVLGEYGTALTWAQDAYTKYGFGKAREYVRTLERRINDEAILKRQMNQ